MKLYFRSFSPFNCCEMASVYEHIFKEVWYLIIFLEDLYSATTNGGGGGGRGMKKGEGEEEDGQYRILIGHTVCVNMMNKCILVE